MISDPILHIWLPFLLFVFSICLTAQFLLSPFLSSLKLIQAISLHTNTLLQFCLLQRGEFCDASLL